ncbi:MAG: hypothetical protein KDE45_23380 [Caldilineaceae bacterium]|nr:hypothetical protein [Caldilineaceae bacterium]
MDHETVAITIFLFGFMVLTSLWPWILDVVLYAVVAGIVFGVFTIANEILNPPEPEPIGGRVIDRGHVDEGRYVLVSKPLSLRSVSTDVALLTLVYIDAANQVTSAYSHVLTHEDRHRPILVGHRAGQDVLYCRAGDTGAPLALTQPLPLFEGEVS